MHRMSLWMVLLLVSAGLVIWGCSWVWLVEPAALLTDTGGPTVDVIRTGRDLAPAATPAAWAVLAGVLAIIATRGWFRAAISALVCLAGVVAVMSVLGSGSRATGALLAIIAGLVIAASGAVSARLARGWPVLGRRYDAPGGTPAEQVSPWEALDRGQDPTDSRPPPA